MLLQVDSSVVDEFALSSATLNTYSLPDIISLLLLLHSLERT
jgi:hypothetical protein